MQQQDLVFRFKGERQYVHGTDMYNQTLAWLAEQGAAPKDIDFAFHRIVTKQLTACPDDNAELADPAAVCSFNVGPKRHRLALVERDEAPTERYPYPEDGIVASMQVDQGTRRGLLLGQPAYTDIEVWVAMTKSLHQQVFPDAKGKWLFVRGRFPEYVNRSRASERSITVAASFNGKLTRSEARLDGVKVGEIFFALT